MGAWPSGGVKTINERVVRQLHIPKVVIDEVIANEEREIERPRRIY